MSSVRMNRMCGLAGAARATDAWKERARPNTAASAMRKSPGFLHIISESDAGRTSLATQFFDRRGCELALRASQLRPCLGAAVLGRFPSDDNFGRLHLG